MVSKLYFTMSRSLQLIVSNLHPCNLPTLFAKLEKEFINKDHMIVMARREELQRFKFTIDSTLSTQFMKYEDMVVHLKEQGESISDNDCLSGNSSTS